MVAKGWERGDGDLVSYRYRVSVLQDEMVLEVDVMAAQCECT